ncbi:MAG TPA: hypothetical protein VF746_03130 [Longimicrobium sp.]|jgi:hypothetical protein
MTLLADHFRIGRRYARSVNIERDLESAEALDGYLLTPRIRDLAERIVTAQVQVRAQRAWTLTGVYGTGKSAFAQFLSSLYAPAEHPARRLALQLLRADGAQSLAEQFRDSVPADGFICAVAAGRRERLAHTLVRALAGGADRFWRNRQGPRPRALKRVRALLDAIERGEQPDVAGLPELVRELASVSRTGVLIVLDELGKNLETAARSGGGEDLYLLQQLAELPNGESDPPVLVLGLMHHAFVEYADGLAASSRSEWEKVHGRFADVPFAEAPGQMLRLAAAAIQADPPQPIADLIHSASGAWHERLSRVSTDSYICETLPPDRIRQLYPLHPLAALALPTLCARYAQNERSLFTFLASPEPHSMTRFLTEREAGEDKLPWLRLADVYDYFVDVAGIALYARPQFQRWAEIHSIVRDALGQDPHELQVLKTIGTLNLVGSTGALRAGRALVIAALSETPGDEREETAWTEVIDRLIARGSVTYRESVDELRVWEGSHHDVSLLLRQRVEAERRPVEELLSEAAPLQPAVAQRASYKSGTLRYFERHYVGSADALAAVECRVPDADGVIAHWVGDASPARVPAETRDGKPLVVLPAHGLRTLSAAVREFIALAELDRDRSSLQNDGVAKREVRQRLVLARRALDEAVATAFTPGDGRTFWVRGEARSGTGLNEALSDACDAAYGQTPIIWNELVNRRELTAQGVRARQTLIAALLNSPEKEKLGLSGHGPEVAMYASLLDRTGIHRHGPDGWRIERPNDDGVVPLWEAIENFCQSAVDRPRPVSELYDLLGRPPYGVKSGVIPVFLAAVLLYHADDVSVYRHGSFLPILGIEHFDLLIKHPAEFAVKHFRLEGLRLDVFRDMEAILTAPGARKVPAGVRNATVLSVVRPLTRFALKLPAVTRGTRRLPATTVAALDALLRVQEPDRLLFEELPRALGFDPFGSEPIDGEVETHRRDAFRRALLTALRELQGYYDTVLDSCHRLLHQAFRCAGTLADTREDVRVRARFLDGRVIEDRLHALIKALVEQDTEKDRWLESVAMVIADKPVDIWSDEDFLVFELNLSELASRFLALYAMQEDALAEARAGFHPRRITIMEPDGTRLQQMVWIAGEDGDLIEQQVEAVLRQLEHIRSEQQRQAIIVRLAERVLAPPAPRRDEAPGMEAQRRHG